MEKIYLKITLKWKKKDKKKGHQIQDIYIYIYMQIRKLEFAIGILVLVVGGCFFSVIVHAKPDPKEVFMGMFIPQLKSGSSTRDAVALLGALIMP